MEIQKQKWVKIIFIALLLISILFRTKSLAIPLVSDHHNWRQTQTAITIQDFFNHGLSVLNYKTPVYGPPWQMPLEFPVYQITVFIFMKIFGMTNIDLGCRLVSLIYFYLSAFALLSLCKIFFQNSKIYFSIFFYYIFTPFSLMWSRAALPDLASVFFGLIYILFFIKWMTLKKIININFLLTMISGILGYLSKSTSMFPVVAILAILIIKFLYDDLHMDYSINLINILNYIKKNILFLLVTLCLCIIPFVVGLLWVKYSDFIKSQLIYTQGLTSKSLKEWNFGTISERFNFDFWGLLFARIHRYFAPYLMIGLFPISIYGLYHSKYNKSAVLFYMSMPIAILFSLSSIYMYYRHEYYFIAVSPYICIIFGFGFYYTCFEIINNKILLKFILFCLFCISLLQPTEYIQTLFYNNEHNGYTSIGEIIGDYIKRTTNKDELIFIQDDSYSPVILYASNRRGFMLSEPSYENKDTIFSMDINFTTLIKKEGTEITKNILDHFNIVPEVFIYDWEIYKLSRLK